MVGWGRTSFRLLCLCMPQTGVWRNQSTHSLCTPAGGESQSDTFPKTLEKLHESTPRTEMQGLVLLARSFTACLAGSFEAPSQSSLFGDSECTDYTMECTDSVWDTWFANRVAEVQKHIDAWKA